MLINNPSVFPGGLDSYSQLPLAIEDVTEIDGELLNTIIDAILRIEHVIGINPAGSLGNLVERLSVSMNDDGTLIPIPIELLTAEPFQDRNIILNGGGKITWNASATTLTWDSDLVVSFPVSGNAPTLLTPQTVLLPATGYVLAVRLSRSGVPQIKPAVTGTLADPALNDNDAVILALRDATGRIYWRNGIIFEDGDSHTFYQMDATRVNYQPGGTDFPGTVLDVQAALTNLDSRVVVNNTSTTTTIGIKETESVNRDNSLQDQLDDLFPNADRNLFMLGGGQYAFNSATGQLFFNQDIILYQNTLAGDAIVGFTSQSPVVLPAVGSIAYISIDRAASADYGVNFTVSPSPIPDTSDTVAIAARVSTTAVRLFSGDMIFADGYSTPYSQGQINAKNVVFDNSISSIAGSPDNVQEALDIIYGQLAALDTNVGSSHFVPTGGIIMLLGSTCPSGYTAMPELQNLFIRGGLTGSTTPVGSDTHSHTGSTNTTGAHTHGAGTLSLSIPVWNQHLSGGGFETDSFVPGTGSGGDLTSNPVVFPLSGSIASGGDHTHTVTVASQSHVPQHAVLLFCKGN